MSDPQAYPDEDGQIAAEGVDPDLVSDESRPEPDDTSPAEEDEDADLPDVP
ncbi:hypothetical protein [Microbacterium sp. CH12i]|uniref:hypothetical protein n=1 Tax=Microbacterium sp. CH12i TaxID=1479651 RepID=UPI000A4E6778|nr:hypothetical protein [Microbacterium sp. CH12i]